MAFRTQKYKVILEDVIEQTIYDYEMQKDYIQFINFLLDTKSMQEAKEEVMHLIPKEEGDILNTCKIEPRLICSSIAMS